MTTRRQAALLIAAAPLAAVAAPATAPGLKVLRLANTSETGFDPARGG